MYNLDLVKINHGLVKAIRLSGAVRRMIGPRGDGCNEIIELDRELRAAAGECQRVIALIEADGKRPLISGGKSGIEGGG